MNKKFQNAIVRYLNRSISFFQGKKRFQFIFKALYLISLEGMNYGKVHSLNKDGEIFQLRKLRTLLERKQKVTLFDVGANEGYYSLKLLEIFRGKEIILHAFEPASDTFMRLKERLQGKGIFLNNLGLSDKKESLILYKSELGSDYASIYYSEKSNYSELIQLTTLDDYCEDNGIEMIDFLKIDVEGHEYKGLLGAKRLLNEKRIHFIQFEFGANNIYSRVFFKDIFEFLTNKGYLIGRILKDGFVPINKYHHNLEVYYTTNYIAWIDPSKY